MPRKLWSLSLKVSLPDGKTLEVANDATSAVVAARIGSGLARSAIAGVVRTNGERQVIDLHRRLPGDCDLSILTADDENPDSLSVLRHSTAHIMAEAICRLFPSAMLVYGPPLEDGFYYDIDLDRAITPDDFPRIEAEMSKIIKENRSFVRYEMPRSQGMEKLRQENSRYKIDNAERADGDTLSFYATGDRIGEDFEDLCRGPHVPSTGIVKAFKIRQVSRSHYRGDVNDQPLQRVYGTAFFKKSSLAAYLKQLEEARKRDHRLLGKELGLFSIREPVGSGLVLWQPKGSVIRNELQQYLTSEMIKLGYDMVYTPHIGHLGMYRTSGHFPYYEESQYPAMFESDRGKAVQGVLHLARKAEKQSGDERKRCLDAVRGLIDAIETAWGELPGFENRGGPEEMEGIIEGLYATLADEPGYLLRPMNCPHHIQLYASMPRSYRDLPYRVAEYGAVYRFEQSGEISGMTRVRGFTQDDAHLFCTADQLDEEILATVDLTRRVLETLQLHHYKVRVGLRDRDTAKYVGSDDNWDLAEDAIRRAARGSGVEFSEETGEAAFYGPKIDFMVKDCIGRNWQLGTVQVDYNLPQRFGLSYVGADNANHAPVMIHRAPFGSMERFVAILIEHFAGEFPLWLSPVQVAVATVSEKSSEYGRTVHSALTEAGFRAKLDISAEKIGPKKHRLRSEKVNYILVVGEQEASAHTVNVNDRSGKTVGNMQLSRFVGLARREIQLRGRCTVREPEPDAAGVHST